MALVILAALLLALRKELGALRQLGHLSPLSVLLLLFYPTYSLVIVGYTQARLLRVFGVFLDWREIVGLQALQRALNMALPSAGVASRAVYLKTVHRQPLTLSGSLVAGSSVLYLAANSISLGVGLVGLWVFEGRLQVGLLLTACIVGTTTLLLMWWPVPSVASRSGLMRHLVKMLNGWHELVARRGLMLWVGFLRVTVTASMCAACWMCLRDIGSPLSVWGVIVLVAAVELVTAVPVSPAALGIAESTIVLAGSALDVDPGQALVLAVALRLGKLAVSLATLPSIWHLRGRTAAVEVGLLDGGTCTVNASSVKVPTSDR